MLRSRVMVIIWISLSTKDCQSLPYGRLQRSSLVSIMVAEEIIHGKKFIPLKNGKKKKKRKIDYLAMKFRWNLEENDRTTIKNEKRLWLKRTCLLTFFLVFGWRNFCGSWSSRKTRFLVMASLPPCGKGSENCIKGKRNAYLKMVRV